MSFTGRRFGLVFSLVTAIVFIARFNGQIGQRFVKDKMNAKDHSQRSKGILKYLFNEIILKRQRFEIEENFSWKPDALTLSSNNDVIMISCKRTLSV